MKSKEAKQKLKEEKEYGYCTIDGRKEPIGNFKVEAPRLFRGRGEHPKQGRLKGRIMPEDVIINCSRNKIPKPPLGHNWKEVRHDPKVTWLACWTDSITGHLRYIKLSPLATLKMMKDCQKFETARRLHQHIHMIRENYWKDMESEDVQIQQRGVAMYLIDKLALRVGNEKDAKETADTVGCCSLRCEHITLMEEADSENYKVKFDFLGKDSIRYLNEVHVDKRVHQKLRSFKNGKEDEDKLFDELSVASLNKYLKPLMPGLTARVFRTYNASLTLQKKLDELPVSVDAEDTEKILIYNRANAAVALLCNHQRSSLKANSNIVKKFENKIKETMKAMQKAKEDLATAKKTYKGKKAEVKKKQYLHMLKEKLSTLKVKAALAKEGKEIASIVSKLYYLDPRITVAWCKKHGISIEKIFTKTQMKKFRWADSMAGPDFRFDELSH
ncbi:unnamed protein product [Darwinula stevensoni]|uniref:DNA topoisomerase 1 n=1 Tax=Darwinula stevensoni TaxID=69355 RepID=A0A7R9A2I5_9CRUS|nr:unnamed protein product [Darwinula stevensoni]CAG0888804.1 unnamed protein product [Darwinula stevensoni]